MRLEWKGSDVERRVSDVDRKGSNVEPNVSDVEWRASDVDSNGSDVYRVDMPRAKHSQFYRQEEDERVY